MSLRVVVDTNIYVSYLIRANSAPGLALAKVFTEATPLLSKLTWDELRLVLMKPKISRYIRPGVLEPFLELIWESSEFVEITSPIRACRDPRDDKFLDVAAHGRADLLITGDQDLLALHPFRSIAIVTPADFPNR